MPCLPGREALTCKHYSVDWCCNDAMQLMISRKMPPIPWRRCLP